MSIATKCDICGALYEPTKSSAYIREIGVAGADGETFARWSDIDLCAPCACKVLDVVGPALNNLSEQDKP